MPRVPTINLQNIDDHALAAIDAACQDHGFFLLTGHGQDTLMTEMWGQSAAFFARSKEDKQTVVRTATNPLGYFDRELTKRKRDQKETFDFRPTDWKTGDGQMPWPVDMPVFEDTLRRYFQANTDMAIRVTQLVCKAMHAAPDTLDHAFGHRHTSMARINHYPVEDPVPENEQAEVNALGDMALHHHTDPGAVTLLYQDDVGGLQALSNEDGWIDIPADPTAIVVNMGDIMQVWTNDRYKAAMHRVTKRPAGQARYSIPFFYQPHADVVIEPSLGASTPTYSAFAWRDFIQGRLDDNFADLGEDDIQVDRFRIA
jgi:isopenicillin N synthase-like dioxygenase